MEAYVFEQPFCETLREGRDAASNLLKEAGVDVYGITGVNSKLVLIDNTIAYVGSANFLASTRNIETVLRLTDHGEVKNVLELVIQIRQYGVPEKDSA